MSLNYINVIYKGSFVVLSRLTYSCVWMYPLIGKDPAWSSDWGQETRATEDETVGWHHQFNGHELGQTLRRWWGTGRPSVLQVHGAAKNQTQLGYRTTMYECIHSILATFRLKKGVRPGLKHGSCCSWWLSEIRTLSSVHPPPEQKNKSLKIKDSVWL